MNNPVAGGVVVIYNYDDVIAGKAAPSEMVALSDLEACQRESQRKTEDYHAVTEAWQRQLTAAQAELAHWKDCNLYPSTYRDAVEQLREAQAEADRLRGKATEYEEAFHEMSQCDDIKLDQPLANCIHDLDEHRQQLWKRAARYEWLRESGLEVAWNSQVSYSPGYTEGDAELMDAAIDTAIHAAKTEQAEG